MSCSLIDGASIVLIWMALGGPALRHRRGPAFWRRGDGLNVSLNDGKGTWYDFAAGEGGGILDLVERVRGHGRADAVRWLAEFRGLPLERFTREQRATYREQREADERDIREAAWWGRSATALAEAVLDWEDPDALAQTLSLEDTERANLTALIRDARSEVSCLWEYRQWRSQFLVLTQALVCAGRESDHRAQRLHFARLAEIWDLA